MSADSPAPAADSTHPARAERLALCELMSQLGPEAPTMCEGWRTADLAAHLVIREHRPDAAAGILLPPLGGHMERVRKKVLATTSFAELLDRIRQGPPTLSIFGLPGMDKALNTAEYFVHHEDVRRAQPGWEPRPADPARDEFLWRRLRGTARLIMRKVPAEVTVVRPDGKTLLITKGGKRARVHGPVSELVLWVFGRTDVAQVRFTGEADAVAALAENRWGV
ncbi:MAG TPA: TIGR03085 family metal-binding protein [Streptosporangiaceae bacterium]|nr:TIGR03085 family metal-binding protein [Streptosporangiaceae bacterium]